MEFIENNIAIPQEKTNANKKVFYTQANQKSAYLYPNGHRITHQMRWFKCSNDRGLRADINA